MYIPTKPNFKTVYRVPITFVLFGLLFFWPAKTARADEIAIWNFNDSNLTVDHGTGMLVSTFSSIGFATGTTINARAGDAAGQALNLTNQTNNGESLTLSVSTVGFTNIIVSFATQRSSTGFNSNQFQYSIDGTTFVDFNSPFSPPTSFGLVTFDLSSISGLNNNLSAAFRIVLNGASASAGSNRIDNLVVEGQPPVAAIPEPSSFVLFGLGLSGSMVIMRRRN